MPGKWENMVEYNMFGPPAEPLPGIKVLKTRTVCHGTYCNRELVKRRSGLLYSQIPGLHFNETYTPVMKWSTFCVILVLGASLGVAIQQFNVKSAYLHGTMKEEAWVQQPEGFEVPGKEHLPLCLQKVLYGTKQGRCQWHYTLLNFMLHKLDWDVSGYNGAMYLKSWDNGM
jgi:hypothetical protein